MRLAELVALYLSRIYGPGSPGPEAALGTPRQCPPTPGTPDRFGQTPRPDLPPSISNWPAEWREVFEERAGIMEFDAGLTCAEAESRATYWTRWLHRSEEGAEDGHDADD